MNAAPLPALSAFQAGMWWEHQVCSDPAAYTVCLAAHLHGPVEDKGRFGFIAEYAAGLFDASTITRLLHD